MVLEENSVTSSILDGSGAQWVVGAATADRYPTNGVGGATATAASSVFVTNPNGTKAVQILGYNVTTTNAAGALVILHDGSSAAAIAGLEIDTTVLGFQPFP